MYIQKYGPLEQKHGERWRKYTEMAGPSRTMAGPRETFSRGRLEEEIFELFFLKRRILMYFIFLSDWLQGPPNVAGGIGGVAFPIFSRRAWKMEKEREMSKRGCSAGLAPRLQGW